jgi:23S rRNA pseudouridine1911/1915/1917 synthase
MKLCWTGPSCSLEDALRALGFTKSSLKKSGLNRKHLNRTIKARSEILIPEYLYNRNLIFPLYEGAEKPRILKESGGFLAVHKPTRVHCHPLRYSEGNNLLSFLREERYFEYLAVNQEAYDRGLLYRLDYETSGLCLFTNNDEVYKEFRETHDEAIKIYEVTVAGKYNGPSQLVHHLSTSGDKIKVTDKGKRARLEVLKQKFSESHNQSLLKVRLHGGLRHQIRVQLAAVGFPLVGDTLYGGMESEIFGLHCLSYKWKDLYFEAGTSWT